MLTACGGSPFFTLEDAGDDGPAETSVPEGDAQDSGGAESEAADGDAADDTLDVGTDAMSDDAMSDGAPACLNISCATPPYKCCDGAFCDGAGGYFCRACRSTGAVCVNNSQCCNGMCVLSMSGPNACN